DSLLVKDPAARVATADDAWESLEEILIRLLGPRWRRDAALPETPAAPPPSEPTFETSHWTSAVIDAEEIERLATAATTEPARGPRKCRRCPTRCPGRSRRRRRRP